MKRRGEAVERPGIDVLEESLDLLRRAPSGVLAIRLLGDMPFALGALFFFTDMTRNAFASQRLAVESLAVAILFLWKSIWQSVFMARLHEDLSGTRVRSSNIARLIAMQCGLQPLALVILPFTLLATIPFAWAVAFFRNAALMAALGEPDAVRRAREQAFLWTRQNWGILGIISLGGLLLFANVLIAIVLLPQAARSLLGMEGDFTRLGMAILNPTTVAIAAALTWLAIDPLLDAVYVVRCFYGVSLRTGEDLYAGLKEITSASINSATAAGALLLLAFLLAMPVVTVRAQNGAPGGSNAGGFSERLDQSIERTIRQPEFAWRAERPQGPEPAGKWANWTRSVLQAISDGVDWLGKKIASWLRVKPSRVENARESPVRLSLQLGMILIGVVLAGCLVAAYVRGRMRKPILAEAAAGSSAQAVDLADESLTADQLPEGSWRILADELARQGEYRKALRALYLAALNYLSGRGLISLHRSKSGLDYRRELDRRLRAHAEVRPELASVVKRNIALFELGWYGAQPVGRAEVDEFLAGFDAMREHAEPK